MCPPLALAGRVGIAFRIGELMMHAMGSYPEQRSTFHGGDGANCKKVLEPLGSLKTAMGEQAVISEANAHDGGYPIEEDGNEQGFPGEEEERREGSQMKQRQKSGNQPVELILVGLILPRSVEAQDAHRGVWFLRKDCARGCKEKLFNSEHFSFSRKRILRRATRVMIGSLPGQGRPGKLVNQLPIGSSVLGFVARRALFENRHKVAPGRGYDNVLASDDVLCLHGMPINLFICVIVRAKGSALEGNSGK